MVKAVSLWTLICSTFLSGCADDKLTPRTQLMLVADTDIPTLDAIQFDVSAGDQSMQSDKVNVAGQAPPYTFAVLREQGPLHDLLVRARGYHGGEQLVERSALVSFVPNETLVVPLHLLHSCMTMQCSGGKTCTEHGCQDPALDPATLEPWNGSAPRLDASVESDASHEGDANGQQDAGSDAAVPPQDAGSTPDAAMLQCGGRLVDPSSDVDNCGKCGKTCRSSSQSSANMLPACIDGACAISCRPLWADCDGDSANGCESYLGSNTQNCGACGVKCAASEYCSPLGSCRSLSGSASAKQN